MPGPQANGSISERDPALVTRLRPLAVSRVLPRAFGDAREDCTEAGVIAVAGERWFE
jgi:hypothetical protein